METNRTSLKRKRDKSDPEVVDLTKEDTVVINISDEDVVTLDDSIDISTPKPTKPTKTKSPPPNTLRCPICIETYVNVKERGLKIVVTRCGHIFCDFCLKKAISDNGRKCPKCRKNVPKGPTGFIEVFDVC